MREGERFNVVSHVIGGVLSVPAVAVLITPPLLAGDLRKAACFAIYGVGLLAIFMSSALFHAHDGAARRGFRQIDRIAIYFVIACTYTPLMVLGLPRHLVRPVLLVTWCLAALGVLVELWVSGRRRPVFIGFYLLMGWGILAVSKPLLASIGWEGLAWLFGGGAVYTVGAGLVRYKLVRRCHEVWHVLAILGSACHYILMLRLLAPI